MKATLALVLIAVVATSSLPAFAKKDPAASGTFQDNKVLNSSITYSDTNMVIDQANAGIITGTFSGTYITYVHLTADYSGNAVYQALDVCTCTVGSKSGTLYFFEQGTITQFVLLSSSATIVDGTSHLDKLQGNIALQGIVFDMQGLTTGTYDGQVWKGSGAP